MAEPRSYICLDQSNAKELVISNLGNESTCHQLIHESNESLYPLTKFKGNKKLPFAKTVEEIGLETNLEPALLQAVIATESGHNSQALSPRGAQGLMQLMPATSRRFGLSNAYNPEENIRVGAKYLRELLDLFDGDLNLSLAAYNAGPNAVLRYGKKIPPYAETQLYVPKVMRLYQQLNQNSL
jgi:soluble lytic murein transglycosylase-like protein